MSIFERAVDIFDIGDEARIAYSETGLTPRQLAEQRAELLGALKRFTSYGDVFAYRPHEGNPYDHAVELIAKCEAAQ